MITVIYPSRYFKFTWRLALDPDLEGERLLLKHLHFPHCPRGDWGVRSGGAYGAEWRGVLKCWSPLVGSRMYPKAHHGQSKVFLRLSDAWRNEVEQFNSNQFLMTIFKIFFQSWLMLHDA